MPYLERMEISLWIMAALYILAGFTHFFKPVMYRKIMPPWVPWPGFWVAFTGIWEIAAGIALLFPETRSVAAWAIIILLIIVLPANIRMMQIYRKKKHPWYWATVLRLPLQLVLIYWAFQYV